MLLHIDRHNGVPAYRQIMDQVRFQIASGAMAPGDELPSTRKLSADLGLNPMTVSKAYGLLEREGTLERRPGKSLVVRPKGVEEAKGGKLDELRRALGPAVTAARQLQVTREELIDALDQLLGEAPDDPTPRPEGETT